MWRRVGQMTGDLGNRFSLFLGSLWCIGRSCCRQCSGSVNNQPTVSNWGYATDVLQISSSTSRAGYAGGDSFVHNPARLDVILSSSNQFWEAMELSWINEVACVCH